MCNGEQLSYTLLGCSSSSSSTKTKDLVCTMRQYSKEPFKTVRLAVQERSILEVYQQCIQSARSAQIYRQRNCSVSFAHLAALARGTGNPHLTWAEEEPGVSYSEFYIRSSIQASRRPSMPFHRTLMPIDKSSISFILKGVSTSKRLENGALRR